MSQGALKNQSGQEPDWFVVTGVAGGLGRACVERLAERGFAGVGLDIDPYATLPEGWEYAQVDIGEEVDVMSWVERASASRPAPAGLVNCAGILGRRSLLTELSLADWRQVQRVNLDGTFMMCREIARWMIKARTPGRIVNVASQLGHVASVEEGHYAASKAGVLHLTRCLAVELAPHGITVNSVSPGVMTTPMLGNVSSDEDWLTRMRSLIPMERLASPDEVVPAIELCLDPRSGYMTGTDLVVDGGWILR